MKPVCTIFLSILILLFSFTAACSAAETDAAENQRKIAEDNNRFAVDLYGRLFGGGGNFFFSPFSISTALTMTYTGARGETASQMKQALRLSLEEDALHEAFGDLIQALNERGQAGGYQLSVANALWAQSGYRFLPAYLDLVAASYDAGLMQADLKKDAEAAREKINAWIEEKTREKIKQLLSPGTVTDSTRLILTNAIYFKGRWMEEFDEDRTRDARFTLLGGDKIMTPMMNRTHEYGYMETDDLQVLSMPYVDKELSMVIILPQEKDGIASLEKSLSSELLAGWMKELRNAQVEVYIPRFRMTSLFDLVEPLKKLRMIDAFHYPQADFSGMNGKKDLFIDKVVHKAFVEVNEEGTEAAAATAVIIETGGIAEIEMIVFRADHPFIFFIWNNSSGSILFMGRVMNPFA